MPSLLVPTPPVDETRETPLDRATLRERIDRVEEEKQRALLDPGPSWRDWWYYSASKWYVGLGLFVLDIWVLGTWLEVGLVLGAVLSLIGVTYLDFLLWQYLYYRPHPDHDDRKAGEPRRWWVHPVEFGRWTPEGHTVRTGGTVVRPSEGPTPEEFL
jgi:hypothetical protein